MEDMDRDEKHFELLLSDKSMADLAIGGYADLNLKVMALFGAGLILLGWLYSDKSPAGIAKGMSESLGAVCCMLAVISCGIIVQGVSTYSLSLGYIQYKNEVLNPAFARLLKLGDLPLKAVPTWAKGAARLPTTVSSALLSLLHAAVSVTLLLVAAYSFPPKAWAIWALSFGWLFLLLTVISELILVRAMKRVLVDGPDKSAG
jgi:hypothetical protein